jgi:predicted AAA+ superfamily ATPase
LEDKANQKFTKNPDLLHDTILEQIEPNVQNYVFIDEVQEVPEFEAMVDSLFIKPDIDLYITGSNAYMTSSEMATLLSGRYVEIKMQPLTFSEFLQFFPDSQDKTAKFQQFMKFGGFPEVANFLVAGAQAQIPLYLQNIYDTVLEKDISKRKHIRSTEDFRNVVLYSFDNIGSITSPTNIANVLKNKDQDVHKQTVNNYLAAMIDCFILYEAKRFDIRGKKLLQTLEKYYTVDLGLVDTILGRPSNTDLGHRLENVVYLELLKRYGQVWVGKNYGKEIDFVVKTPAGLTEYYQVALNTTEQKTLEREISAFANTGDHYQKLLLTMDSFETDETGIERKNVIDWLLES